MTSTEYETIQVKFNEKIMTTDNKFAFEPFFQRHIGPKASDETAMLKEIHAESLEQLIEETIPKDIRLSHELHLKKATTEQEFLSEFKKIAQKNQLYRSHIGMGYHPCFTPTVIQRNILENPGWYTQYTPYQSEISQGRMEALLNYQTLIMDLTGMEIANSSLLDEGTAAAEAMFMCWNLAQRKKGKKGSPHFFVSPTVFPQTLEILQTRAEPLGIKIISGNLKDFKAEASLFGGLIQYPDNHGNVEELTSFCKKLHDVNALCVVAADLLSLCLLKAPGEYGADVVIGTSQRLGVPMAYGGPHAGYFATREEFKRQIPGRIIGVSVDNAGKKALRMALQTREQHIRREKATSNICTAQVLLAIMSSMYAVYHGPQGIKKIALRIHELTMLLEAQLTKLGFKQMNTVYFDTLRVSLDSPIQAESVKLRALEKNINLRYFNDPCSIGLSLNETSTPNHVDDLLSIFSGTSTPDNLLPVSTQVIPHELQRNTDFLTHPVFNSYHSETEMLRYIKRLENKDLSLTTSMISLGSCTMKLNATTEMIPITWPELAELHPFIPLDQAKGYTQLFKELEEALAQITGFTGVSLQPNAGAQGEYAGLLTIRKYHQSRGNSQRNVILIPSSAHGTNPASAALAGMKIHVTRCDEKGNIDVQDLQEKALHYKDTLAGLMITYPSTHGVFEKEIRLICDSIHTNGGLVYMDGANMNAQVGLTHPGEIGADVCHLNLHKTFCIPHGGGGPGVGPICVNDKLKPFLPSHPVISTGGEQAIKAVSAAPWGSAGVLAISWAYIAMMGASGLKKSTEVAILNANYMLHRLKKQFPILYTGPNGRVAHEFIVDFRPLKKETHVDVVDVAKRLMDYGFHAPTISFPVPGTMMIEPTESESKEEMDRFCDALLSIGKEMEEIKNGSADPKDNVLFNAPHTQDMIVGEWTHPYSREKAVFPTPYVRENKYWPPVGRVDNTRGDKLLICSCPPLESY